MEAHQVDIAGNTGGAIDNGGDLWLDDVNVYENSEIQIATDYLERLGEEPPERVRAWRARCFDVPAMQLALAEAQPMLDAREARLAAAKLA